MALVLKKLTHEVPEKKSDSDDNDSESQNPEFERSLIADVEWTKFCNSTLKVHETKWTKKLEEYEPEDRLKPKEED
jgi:hypothetical protein